MHLSPADAHRLGFIIAMLVWSIAMMAALVFVVHQGKPWWAAALMLVASPLLILVIFCGLQGGSVNVLIDIKHASWAAWCDMFVLPPMMAYMAVGWGKYGRLLSGMWGGWWISPWWYIISYAIGLAGGIMFHLSGGKSEGLHNSPMSWAHNFGIFPGLLGAITCVMVPLFSRSITLRYGLIALLVGGGIWGVASVFDVWRNTLPIEHPFSNRLTWTDIIYNWAHMRPL